MIVLLIVFCVFIIGYDFLFRRVPNSLLLTALLVHSGYMLYARAGVLGTDLSQSLIGAGVALLVFVPLYAMRAMGAGDVKLLIVLGAVLGVSGLLTVWLIGSLIAGLHALLFYASQIWVGFIPPVIHRVVQQVGQSDFYQRVVTVRQGRKGAPYAAYLAIGVLFHLMMTWRGQ
ncbi:hypothetical protein DBR37_09750 [Herminiimonas sp. KBW02]|uniref:A24 family peptidase n=1 Tax=Herminiimonas sp. KBW02 TaxID=2153363 RepID=UPI000F59171C|nr:A24 family peptidase [Herminiimonas sp. KBW02]RQO34660.1 hypothetical protein DBR37_09750 [Herminiimonas sp. KBW02]